MPSLLLLVVALSFRPTICIVLLSTLCIVGTFLTCMVSLHLDLQLLSLVRCQLLTVNLMHFAAFPAEV